MENPDFLPHIEAARAFHFAPIVQVFRIKICIKLRTVPRAKGLYQTCSTYRVTELLYGFRHVAKVSNFGDVFQDLTRCAVTITHGPHVYDTCVFCIPRRLPFI